MKTVLVTGGAGYIGSEICNTLHNSGYDVIGVDKNTEHLPDNLPYTVRTGNLSTCDIDDIIGGYPDTGIDCVIHAAGRAYVGESITNPSLYWTDNVMVTNKVLNYMKRRKIHNLVFSSSCSVYKPITAPIKEYFTLEPISPYGKTKSVCEDMIKHYSSEYDINYTILRYFNVVGVNHLGMTNAIGDNSRVITSMVSRVLRGEAISIYGKDYDTDDGTAIRNFIHVNDIADAHHTVMTSINNGIYNVGANISSSMMALATIVLEVGNTLGIETNNGIHWADRRVGDCPVVIANVDKFELIFEKKYIIDLYETVEEVYRVMMETGT